LKKSTATPSSLKGFNQKLLGYSATAGAALLLAPASHAQTLNIEYFNVFPFAPGGPPTFTVTSASFNLGVRERRFGAWSAGHSPIFTALFLQSNNPVTGGNLRFHVDGSGVEERSHAALLLGNNSRIAGAGLLGSLVTVAGYFRPGHAAYGNFLPIGPNAHASGYIGFKIATNEYGWLRIKVTNDAYGAPITVAVVAAQDGLLGQVGDSSLRTPSAIPEPADVASGLGLLALGAAGVRELRRRRAVAAQ